ncbi:hypothetical protein DFH09DRAFT_1281513 [Mycena vulgaris]|nr:hypothetical protein DFH09DRAFT_1281513 [Mycena vulgaris]
MSLPTFSSSTTADEVASAFAGEIQGKNVLITGTSLNGIGFEAALAIAKDANLVIITGYNSERLRLSEKAIKKEVPAANIRRLTLDLSSLAAVRTAAAEVNAYPEPLHVLIHNAAASGGPFRLTEDNLELHMATDHFGPFLLTKLVTPKLLAAATASYVPRVVFVSSSAHALGTGVNFTTLTAPDAAKYEGFEAYCQAKSTNALMAIELSKRSKGKINAYSLHPGTLVTDIVSNMTQKEEAIPYLQAIGEPLAPIPQEDRDLTTEFPGMLDADGKPNTEKFEWKTLPQGSRDVRRLAPTVAAAFDTRLNDKPGAYLADSTEANKDLAPHSSDQANAEKLWSVTEADHRRKLHLLVAF